MFLSFTVQVHNPENVPVLSEWNNKRYGTKSGKRSEGAVPKVDKNNRYADNEWKFTA